MIGIKAAKIASVKIAKAEQEGPCVWVLHSGALLR